MALSRKKPDPISDKARALNAEIAALEAQIKKLDAQLSRPAENQPPDARPAEPRFRSTATPHGSIITRPAEKPPSAAPPRPGEPVFEEINRSKLTSRDEAPEMFNELGVRKYDLPALWHRLGNHLRGPGTSNPRLINYLAAGGVHGLRPLRYEKRVARNRFILLVVVVSIVLFGLFYIVLGHR
jgi:hypothetical protein